MFDLEKNNLSKAAEAGYKFELLVPGTDEPTGAFITVRGAQSKKVKEHAKKKYQELKQREVMARRKGKDDELSLAEAEELAIETAIVRIIDWEGLGEGGVAIPFNQENAERVLKEHPWIREQIMNESDQLLNFRPD